jgi:hypothetical protein
MFTFQLIEDQKTVEPWNKGKLVGQRRHLKLKEIWGRSYIARQKSGAYAAYARGDLLEIRRKMIKDWQKYLDF